MAIPKDEHLLTLPEKVHAPTDTNIVAYDIYEQAYVQACEEALRQVEEGLATPVWVNPDTAKAYLTPWPCRCSGAGGRKRKPSFISGTTGVSGTEWVRPKTSYEALSRPYMPNNSLPEYFSTPQGATAM